MELRVWWILLSRPCPNLLRVVRVVNNRFGDPLGLKTSFYSSPGVLTPWKASQEMVHIWREPIGSAYLIISICSLCCPSPYKLYIIEFLEVRIFFLSGGNYLGILCKFLIMLHFFFFSLYVSFILSTQVLSPASHYGVLWFSLVHLTYIISLLPTDETCNFHIDVNCCPTGNFCYHRHTILIGVYFLIYYCKF